MRTLFLNPPSFEGFDGGASSRWPASREIESYWYPVWLCYPAGMLPDSKVVDAPPHKISIEQTVEMAKDFELLVLFTSTPGFHVDVKIAEMMKDVEPEAEGGVRRTAGHGRAREDAAARTRPSISWCAASSITRSPTTPRASRWRSCRASASARTAASSTTRKAGYRESGRAALGDQGLQARSGRHALQRSVPAESVHLVLHVARLPGACARSACGRRRTRATAGGCARPTTSPTKCATRSSISRSIKEIFFDDDTFNYRKERTIELCKKLKPLNFTWSCTSRVTTDYDTLKAMKEAGCRLLIVGYESGDPQILKNIKKGATVDMAQRFTANCKKLGPDRSTAISSSGCPAKRARASARPSISPSGWTPKRFRSRSRIRIPAPSSTITSRRTT